MGKMLSLEYLLEEAKNNSLPSLKRRAIIREYLQILILNSIYKQRFSRHFFFMGGTAMRYFYNLPRFSEDLDFNAKELDYDDFITVLRKTSEDISDEGFSVELTYNKRNAIFISEIVFIDAVSMYNISDKRSMKLMIKVEVNSPNWELNIEPQVLSMYGYNFAAILMSKGNLLSEKICALFNRKRGRDIYDTLFMLKRKFPFNEDVFKSNNIKLPIKETLLSYFHGLDDKELKRQADQVKPFLFKEDDVELILKAPLYAERFLQGYGL